MHSYGVPPPSGPSLGSIQKQHTSGPTRHVPLLQKTTVALRPLLPGHAQQVGMQSLYCVHAAPFAPVPLSRLLQWPAPSEMANGPPVRPEAPEPPASNPAGHVRAAEPPPPLPLLLHATASPTATTTHNARNRPIRRCYLS